MIYLLPGGQVGTFQVHPKRLVFKVTKKYIKIPIEIHIVKPRL